MQKVTMEHNKTLLYPTEPLQDGTPVLVKVNLATGMPSDSGTLAPSALRLMVPDYSLMAHICTFLTIFRSVTTDKKQTKSQRHGLKEAHT